MFRDIKDIVSSFNANPILFMGSGITRRYYNLPNWRGLLEIFISKISDDEFAYSSYLSKATDSTKKENLIFQKMADYIEEDFNKKWYEDKEFRSVLDDIFVEKIREGICTPFKAEIAQYIKNNSIINEAYHDEIEKLKEISKKSISGILTTNYDNFFENNFDGYKSYIGQNELIFSNIQEIGEIYKIHGSIEKPETIIINSRDYEIFEEKSQYLAAKLLTMFMEYPIIFLGYSISDSNIQNILNNIIKCLTADKVELLKNRFIFVEYTQEDNIEISSHTIKVDNKLLQMTKIKLKDFNILYNEIGKRKNKIPVRILRKLKEEFYEYIITNTPTAQIRVASIDDKRIEDEDLAISIGKISELSLKGLNGLTANEWYRSIILDDLKFGNDALLEYAPRLQAQNSGFIPLNKYLSKDTKKKYTDLAQIALRNDWNKIISNSIRKNKRYAEKYNSVIEIWKELKVDKTKATRLIAYLDKEKIKIEELESILIEIFNESPNVLEDDEKELKTNIRRLIKIYDYLKYSDKVKELFN